MRPKKGRLDRGEFDALGPEDGEYCCTDLYNFEIITLFCADG